MKFSYKALDPQGRERQGTVEANSAADATAQLRSRSLHVLKLDAGGQAFSLIAFIAKIFSYISIKRYTSASAADQVIFFRQLSLMLRSGNTLMQGLELCSEMTEKVQLRNSLINILVAIQGGSSFANAIEKQGSKFPPIVAKLIASGEASGELQMTLERLADSLERSAALKRQFVSSLIYPVLVITAAVGVTLFLAISIVPKFAKLLEGKSQQLPAATQVMMDVSAWLIDYGFYLGVTVGVVIFAILVAYTTKVGKAVIDRILINLPLIGNSIKTSGMAQMGWTMSMLLSSGLTVLESLRVVSSVVSNDRLSLCFSHASDEILAGRSLAVGLNQRNIPMMVQHMAGIGERSGELEHVMLELGRYYQDQAEVRIKRMIAMIEPAMTLVVGGLVGGVYYAFFKAMMQVSAG